MLDRYENPQASLQSSRTWLSFRSKTSTDSIVFGNFLTVGSDVLHGRATDATGNAAQAFDSAHIAP